MTNTVLMPSALTAENGAKALLIGEFHETLEMACPVCGGSGDIEEDLTELLAEVGSWPGLDVSPFLRAQVARMSARLAAASGNSSDAEEGFGSAIAQFRKIDDPYSTAEPLVELAEVLLTQGRVTDAEPLLAEAREIFERLGARPWLERIEAVEGNLLRVASQV